MIMPTLSKQNEMIEARIETCIVKIEALAALVTDMNQKLNALTILVGNLQAPPPTAQEQIAQAQSIMEGVQQNAQKQLAEAQALAAEAQAKLNQLNAI